MQELQESPQRTAPGESRPRKRGRVPARKRPRRPPAPTRPPPRREQEQEQEQTSSAEPWYSDQQEVDRWLALDEGLDYLSGLEQEQGDQGDSGTTEETPGTENWSEGAQAEGEAVSEASGSDLAQVSGLPVLQDGAAASQGGEYEADTSAQVDGGAQVEGEALSDASGGDLAQASGSSVLQDDAAASQGGEYEADTSAQVDGGAQDYVFQSSDKDLDGLSVAELGADIYERAQRYADSVPAQESLAESAQQREEQWFSERGFFGRVVDLFNSQDAVEPARWEEVVAYWDQAASEFAAALAISVSPDTLKELALQTEMAIRAYQQAMDEASRQRGAFNEYLTGFQSSSENATFAAEITRDLAVVSVVLMGSIVAAPYLLSAASAVGSTVVGTAESLAGSQVAKTVATQAAKVALETVKGGASKAAEEAVSAAAGEALEFAGDLVDPDISLSEALDGIDTDAILDAAMDGLVEGAIEGFADGIKDCLGDIVSKYVGDTVSTLVLDPIFDAATKGAQSLAEGKSMEEAQADMEQEFCDSLGKTTVDLASKGLGSAASA